MAKQSYDYLETDKLVPVGRPTTVNNYYHRDKITLNSHFLVEIDYQKRYGTGDPEITITSCNATFTFTGIRRWKGLGLPIMGSPVTILIKPVPPVLKITTREISAEEADIFAAGSRCPISPIDPASQIWTSQGKVHSFTRPNQVCKINFANIYEYVDTGRIYRSLTPGEQTFLFHFQKANGLPPVDVRYGANNVETSPGNEHVVDEWLAVARDNSTMPTWRPFQAPNKLVSSRADQFQHHLDQVASLRSKYSRPAAIAILAQTPSTSTILATNESIDLTLALDQQQSAGPDHISQYYNKHAPFNHVVVSPGQVKEVFLAPRASVCPRPSIPARIVLVPTRPYNPNQLLAARGHAGAAIQPQAHVQSFIGKSTRRYGQPQQRVVKASPTAYHAPSQPDDQPPDPRYTTIAPGGGVYYKPNIKPIGHKVAVLKQAVGVYTAQLTRSLAHKRYVPPKPTGQPTRPMLRRYTTQVKR